MRKIQVVILTNGWVKDNVKNLDILYGGLTMAYFKEALFFGIFLIDICEILCEVRIWNLWDKFQCIGSGQIGQFRRVPPQFFLGLATHTKCTYSMQKFLAWNCYHFCWVKNIIMVRRVPPRIFLVFATGTKYTYGPHTSSYVQLKMFWKNLIFLSTFFGMKVLLF